MFASVVEVQLKPGTLDEVNAIIRAAMPKLKEVLGTSASSRLVRRDFGVAAESQEGGSMMGEPVGQHVLRLEQPIDEGMQALGEVDHRP